MLRGWGLVSCLMNAEGMGADEGLRRAVLYLRNLSENVTSERFFPQGVRDSC